MAGIKAVLVSSFGMLFESPQLFVPKLASTTLSSLFLVFLVSEPDIILRIIPMSYIIVLTILAVFSLSFIGLFASLMVSSIVKYDYGEKILLKSFKDAVGQSGKIFRASLGLFLFSFTVSLLVMAGYWASVLTGELIFLMSSIVLGLLTVVIASFSIYFLPITLLEEPKLLEGLKSSSRFSKENYREVALLITVSILLLIAAGFSSGLLEKAGYIGFVAGRLVATVVNTYLFVVSPSYYLEG